MECVREDSQVLGILRSFYLLLAISPRTLHHPPFIHRDFWQMLTLIKSKWWSLDAAPSEGLRKISALRDEMTSSARLLRVANVLPHHTCAQELFQRGLPLLAWCGASSCCFRRTAAGASAWQHFAPREVAAF